MRINLSTVIHLAGIEGRNTLQIPEADIEFIQPRGLPVLVPITPNDTNGEYPDDFFMEYNSKGRPVIGRESGFLYLTRKGYNYFRQHIALARANSQRNRDIESLDLKAEETFAKIERVIARERQMLEAKIAELNAFTVTQP